MTVSGTDLPCSSRSRVIPVLSLVVAFCLKNCSKRHPSHVVTFQSAHADTRKSAHASNVFPMASKRLDQVWPTRYLPIATLIEFAYLLASSSRETPTESASTS